MLPQNKPDRIRILFDDHRLVANAGLLLPATLARHLGLRELVDHHLDLGGAPGRANTGDKMLTLVASALAGGDCIDAADALRAGGTVGVLGCVVKAPSRKGIEPMAWDIPEEHDPADLSDAYDVVNGGAGALRWSAAGHDLPRRGADDLQRSNGGAGEEGQGQVSAGDGGILRYLSR